MIKIKYVLVVVVVSSITFFMQNDLVSPMVQYLSRTSHLHFCSDLNLEPNSGLEVRGIESGFIN